MPKPTIFIGSSTEGLEVANSVQHNLEHYAEVTVWTQDVFKLSIPIITSLVKSLSQFQFAIFVFSPDDISNIRGIADNTVRDNIIFETGLFAGRLGTERVYLIKPRGVPLHLPSDMLGIVIGEYDTKRSDGNLIAATGTFCNQVKSSITEILNSQVTNDKLINNLERDLRLIEAYLIDKGWTQITFEKMSQNINPRFNEDFVMKIIEAFPDRIRRGKIRGLFGIKLLKTDRILKSPDEKISFTPFTKLIITIDVSLTENISIIKEKINNIENSFHFSSMYWADNKFEIDTPLHLNSESLIIYKLRDVLKDYRLKEIGIYNSTQRNKD